MTTWTTEEIRKNLLTNDEWVERAIVAIYKLQTRAEQATQSTREHNGVGFNSADARRGSYYARWIMSGKHLSGRHRTMGRRLIVKYASQLVKIAKSKKENM